jgi:hypothetical protein
MLQVPSDALISWCDGRIDEYQHREVFAVSTNGTDLRL